VKFARGVEAQMIGIDGSWQRQCTVFDISASGARLILRDPSHHPDRSEFFLLLSSVGAVHRRCKVVRRAGDQIGVKFLKPTK
jgi:hypothetical protein